MATAGDRGGALPARCSSCRRLGKDLFRLDGTSALVLAPALVRPSDPAQYGPDGKVFVAETREGGRQRARLLVEQEVITPEQGAEMARRPARGFIVREGTCSNTGFVRPVAVHSRLAQGTPELKRYYPTNAGHGFDIIFFWVARMMMLGLQFMDEVPFSICIRALVRDEKGARCRSEGNVTPLHLIDEYGADTLRFTLAAMAAQARHQAVDPARQGYEFRDQAVERLPLCRDERLCCLRGFDPTEAKQTLNRWIAHETSRATSERAIEAYRFNDAAGAI
jgi:valyl-tRNA synthetase